MTAGWTAAVRAGEPGRPRIFVTPGTLVTIRERASQAGPDAEGHSPAAGWKTLRERADAFLAAEPYAYSVDMPGKEGAPPATWSYVLSDEPPPRHDDYAHYPPWTAMFQERTDSITTRIRLLSFAYLVTGDPAYAERARRIVMHLCAWPGAWTDPSYGGGRACLDTGHAAMWVGVFYDWCGDTLDAADARTVRTALLEKALLPIDERIDDIAPYHNFTAVLANGLCVGALAVLGEDDRAEALIAHGVERLRLYMNEQGSDGGSMEGPMYGTYAANQLADTLRALDGAGVEHALWDHPFLRTLPAYCLALLDPGSGRQPCFGDGGLTAGFGDLMLARALAGDSRAARYCRATGQFVPDTVRRFTAAAMGPFPPDDPAPVAAACFADVGYAVLRHGTDRAAPFLAFKSGPPTAVIGHNHYDHNSFILLYAGRQVAADPGYRDYFDPPARRYSVGTLGHNSIVLDADDAYRASQAVTSPGHDQVHLNRGRLAEFFTSDRVDSVAGDAAEAYNPDGQVVLTRFRRRIVYAKPHLFFVRDDLRAPEPHTFTFLLHGEQGAAIEAAGQTVRIRTGGARLDASVYAPGGTTLFSGSYPGAERFGPYAAVTSTRGTEAVFTAVLVPRSNPDLLLNPGFEDGLAGWQIRNRPGFTENHSVDTEVPAEGAACVRIDRGGYVYSNRFSVPPGTRIAASWQARCTAETGASSLFYYWKGGVAFARTEGPSAAGDTWQRYELADTVPEGTEEVCLALQFFGEGTCRYDDVRLAADTPVPRSEEAAVEPLAGGRDGAVARIGGETLVFLCGDPREERTFAAAGHRFTVAAEVALIRIGDHATEAFAAPNAIVRMDGETLPSVEGTWRTDLPFDTPGP